MIVDDRLETVLRTVAAGPGAIATQMRQLVDLLGRTPTPHWTGTHAAALDRIDSLGAMLGDAPSAALIRTCSLRSPHLVAHLAAASPKTALAAMMSARLAEQEWLSLIPNLPVPARGFLRHRRDLGQAVEALLARLGITDFALPLPEGFEPLALAQQPELAPLPQTAPVEDMPPVLAPAAPPAPEEPAPLAPPRPAPFAAGEGISAIIRRIEAFQRARAAQTVDAPGEPAMQTRLPFADEPQPAPRPVTAIDLTLDAYGTVVAADRACAPAFVGLRPFAADPDAPIACDPATRGAALARLPIAGGHLTLEGTGATADVKGTWRIDAVPRFSADAGHFMGYHARLRRPPAAATAKPANDDTPGRSADRLRQMLHELRTPINAIQGFAELIQQQLLGPTPHQYRSLAAGIASDAARMLAGFEDVERLAVLEAAPAGKAPANAADETDIGALVGRLVHQLDPVLAPREVRLRCVLPDGPLPVGAASEELERPLWRLLSLAASMAVPGEDLALTLQAATGQARLVLPLPAAIAGREDAALTGGEGMAGMAGGGAAMLGGGFALRLALAEFRALGGVAERGAATIDVTLPLLTDAPQTLSHIL
ncbi:MAG: histidine kinase dimerization/phospho-acceptor domain-containing protein [Novosphingobium sp.]|uniref:sensor histidine kinase n=1 Tax=Novosphingobium sp. TaxID=1874826 RepID=UPI003017190F